MKSEMMIIPRNPSQAPASLFRVTRTLKVRGDAIYIIFGGIAASVFIFFIAMDLSLILALGTSWMPLAAALWFYFKFVREKPKYYFDYALNGLFGRRLIAPKRKKNAERKQKHA